MLIKLFKIFFLIILLFHSFFFSEIFRNTIINKIIYDISMFEW